MVTFVSGHKSCTARAHDGQVRGVPARSLVLRQQGCGSRCRICVDRQARSTNAHRSTVARSLSLPSDLEDVVRDVARMIPCVVLTCVAREG